MNQFVIFAFNGNPMCFVHVLLNALDLESKGMGGKIVIEGEAVKLVEEMETSGSPLYRKAKEKGLIDCICRACSSKMGVLEYNATVGIPLGGDMTGHPSFSSYIEKGHQVITL